VTILRKMKRVRLNSKARRAWQGSSRGFTLLEVMMAIALIGIIVVAIMTALSTAATALIIADRRATAESLARTQMEYVKDDGSNPYDDGDPQAYEHGPVESTDHPGYFVSVSAEPLHDPDDGIQLITVTVSYEIVGAENIMLERQFTLEDYKREVET
jgi:prepilin-type N-terminal cleavage/methylation domain-containing protein